jgi:hypothetical protein
VENLDDLETETPVPILYLRQPGPLPDRPFIGRSGISRPSPRTASIVSAGSGVAPSGASGAAGGRPSR